METIYTDEYFMRIALTEAQYAFEKGEIPVGCVLVAQDRILSRSHNLTEQLKDVTAHAELQIIASASQILGGKYLRGCTLYVTIEPCQMCAGALYWSQIDRLVFGAGDNKRGYTAMGGHLHPKTEIISGVLEPECRELMRNFFKSKRI